MTKLPVDPQPAVTFTVTTEVTERLDRFLADQLQYSRTHAARLVSGGHVTVDGKSARSSRLLNRGELISVTVPTGESPRTIVPMQLPLDIVFEDEHLVVIDKPAGLVVHPAPGHWDDTLVNALIARGTTLSGGAAGRPGIVHRLDRDTSGLMVVAKTDLSHRRLGAMLQARNVKRIYAALAWGHLGTDRVIDAPLGRHTQDRKRMAIRPDGRTARTDAFVVARLGPVDLLRLELHSGRTHQIRVHLESIGHPVVGDSVYGGGGAKRMSGPEQSLARRLERLAPRQALHAVVLEFRHPITDEPIRLRSQWPESLWSLLEAAIRTETPEGEPVPSRERALGNYGFFDSDD